jgi:hypothetical protein
MAMVNGEEEEEFSVLLCDWSFGGWRHDANSREFLPNVAMSLSALLDGLSKVVKFRGHFGVGDEVNFPSGIFSPSGLDTIFTFLVWGAMATKEKVLHV